MTKEVYGDLTNNSDSNDISEVSAVIEEKDWQTLNNARVIQKWGGSITPPEPEKTGEAVKTIHSIQNISGGEIGGIEFQVQPNFLGKISEIGVQFINEAGKLERQSLQIQADGKYIVAFSTDSCKGCKDLKPYYLLSGSSDIFIASHERDIEVASSSYEIFKNVITNIWFWHKRNKENKKIIDIKAYILEAGKGASVDLILQTVAQNSINGINFKIGEIPTSVSVETFPVAGYLLDKFLNGPEGDIIFNDGHWISQKIKQTKKYDLLVNKISDVKLGDFVDMNDGDKKLLFSGSSEFNKIYLPKNEADMFFGIKKFDYEIYILKFNGKLYSKIKIGDDYDFPSDADYGDGLTNSLNALGYYHQANLRGKVFHWDAIITEQINYD